MQCLPFSLRDVNIFTIMKKNAVTPADKMQQDRALDRMCSWKTYGGLWKETMYLMEKCANEPRYHCKGLPQTLNLLSSLTCSLIKRNRDSCMGEDLTSLQKEHSTTGAKVLEYLETLLSRIALAKAPLEDLRATLLIIFCTIMTVYLITVSESKNVSVISLDQRPVSVTCIADRDFQCWTAAPSHPITSARPDCGDHRSAQFACQEDLRCQ